ncbi:MAG: alpha/beta fold hydrolase [Deltaproteobacteria bacterium]|nr:alpha/beta fold hydrolase [Deltaproteobacteria bacterium]MBW2120716.1 alpha/beta fold hydrolase [Deltaproteobacteria bacterium]
METREITFSVGGKRLAGVLHLPGRRSPPCVITCHGLLSNKDSEKYLALAALLSREGLAVLRFDFLGCGESEGKLEDSTVTGRLEELTAAMEYVRTNEALGDMMGLMGSSLGGYLSLFKAAQERDVRAVATWSTPYRLSPPSPDAEAIPVLGEGFYADLKTHDLIPILKDVRHCLVIHGDSDELVPLTHASVIYENVREPKRLEIIRGADHRFSDPEHREKAYRLTTAWFNGHLNP